MTKGKIFLSGKQLFQNMDVEVFDTGVKFGETFLAKSDGFRFQPDFDARRAARGTVVTSGYFNYQYIKVAPNIWVHFSDLASTETTPDGERMVFAYSDSDMLGAKPVAG